MGEEKVAGLVDLCEAHWYDAAAAMMAQEIAQGTAPRRVNEALALVRVAVRTMALDAEDFDQLAAGVRGRPWAGRLAACAFPQGPRDSNRGALGDLVPLYELLLEVIDLRAERQEPQQVVVVAHLIGEYLCQLAWQSRLGHGGDPLRLPRDVGGRWGTDDPECAHNSAMRATAKRAVNAALGDQAGFTSYLDKFHSRLGDTLAVCAMNHVIIDAGERPDVGPTCPNPCQWVLRGSRADQRDLDARLRLALVYLNSPLVALRHHAPVGHFFGVPSWREIADAWILTWEKLTKQWPDEANPLVRARITASEEALPGMAALVSTVAGRPISAGTLVRDIGADVTGVLTGR